MIYTLDMLVNNNNSIITYYKEAVKQWNEIWINPESENEESLAGLLPSRQMFFEAVCGGREIGREIMVNSGFAYLCSGEDLFSDVNKEKAIRLMNAYSKSYCSGEVIAKAKRVANMYYLDEE